MVRFGINFFKIIGILIVVGIVAGLVGSTFSLVLKLAVPIVLIYLGSEGFFRNGFANLAIKTVGILMIINIVFRFIHFIF